MDLVLLESLERERILEVLRRDKQLRTIEEHRIRRMKFQLQELRRRGVKSCSKEYDKRTCARCQRPLGKLCNTGAVCHGCSHRICSKCRVFVGEAAWKCTICYAYRQVKIQSGDWFLDEKMKKFHAQTDKYEPVGEELLKNYNVHSYIAIVPPTPPAKSEFDFLSRSGDAKKSNDLLKSVEDFLFSFTKMSSSQNDVTATLLDVDCSKQLYSRTEKSLSDTDISRSVRSYQRSSLPNIFRKTKDSDHDGYSTGAEEDTSNSSENSDRRRGSFSSISTESSLLESISASGDMELAVGYNTKKSCLEITVGMCRNLPYGDPRKKTCHPYVTLYMMPPKSHKKKTTVKKNTTNPDYNELFQIHIARHLLIGKRLHASVWHSRSLHKKVFLGEVLIPLDGFQYEDKDFQCFNWYPLCPQHPEGDAIELHGG
ncbi:synaptotagmin-like protein 3 [Stigmatopora nigra]